jgi:hypothetical protein
VGGDDDDKRKTWKGLRPEGDMPTLAISESDRLARDADARASSQEEAKWRALFDTGLVSLESVPELRDQLKWSKCDDVEVRVLLRARGGARIAQMLDDATYSPDQIVQAICRLASRRLLRIA